VAVERRRLDTTRGEVARWRHSAALPALELRLYAAGEFGGYPEHPALVQVSTWPGPIAGITDPAELRAIAWLVLDAARWLERQTGALPTEPDPQLTIYDHLEEVS
jgi:hypothetical protein